MGKSINKTLSEIKILEFIAFCFIVFLILILSFTICNYDIDSNIFEILLYGIILIYFLYKIRNSGDVKYQLKYVFEFSNIKEVTFLIVTNILLAFAILFLASVVGINIPFDNASNNFINLCNVSGDIFLVVILAPLVEEFVFRGVFLRWLNSKFNVYIAILVTSLIFGLLHDFGGIISAIIFGVCMSILYIKTNDIFVPISVHIGNNFISEFLTYFKVENFIFSNDIFLLILCVVVLISIISLFYYLFSNLRNITHYLKTFELE
jgi:membrane protease YdiL (CAAX protease family)